MTTLPIYPGTPPPAPVSSQQRTAETQRERVEIDPAIFRRELDSRIKPDRLTFSRHAQKRLQMRGIEFTPQGLKRIEEAVDKASEKGSRDAVVLAGDMTLVVNVKNRAVITVMGREDMQESVITNIDTAVFA
jgi:flagellar operon protein